MVPAVLVAALDRVRQQADFMPFGQVSAVLSEQLGNEWRGRVVRFDESPVAAASIGQVHRGCVLREGREVEVVFKVQYPGVERSIRSDLDNLMRMVRMAGFVPRSFFVEEGVKEAERELMRECDYVHEATSQRLYRGYVQGEDMAGFYVPEVVDELSGRHVLVSEYVPGIAIDRVEELNMGQPKIDELGRRLMWLTLMELFIFRFQQSDPNWSNFLYDARTDTINLIDFGAATTYPPAFLHTYLSLIHACANRDRARVLSASTDLGFLTGLESKAVLDAHVAAAFAVGEPFGGGVYDFVEGDVARRTAKFGKVLVEGRLKAPPREAYSLHRRLSGAFLTLGKIGARVNGRELLETVTERVRRKEEQEEREGGRERRSGEEGL